MQSRMNPSWALTCLGAILASAIVATIAGAVPPPPPTRVDSVVDTLHGVVIPDPYRWLEDQDSPETRAWIDAQNAYAHSLLDTVSGRDKLEQRFTELFKMDQRWVTKVVGNRYFLSKRKAGDPLSSMYMRDGLDGPDQLLIDPLTLSPDTSVTAGIAAVTGDGKVMAYSLRKGGQDETAIRFKNLETKQDLPDTLPPAKYFGGMIFTAAGWGLYYGISTAEGPRVYLHEMGSTGSEDRLVFGKEYDDEWLIDVAICNNKRYLVLTAYKGSSGDITEIYFADLVHDGTESIVTVVKGIEARFEPLVVDRTMFIKTNWQAENDRIMTINLDKPPFNEMQELIPMSPLPLQDMYAIGGHLFVKYLDSVKTKIKVYDPDGTYLRDLQFPTIGMTGSTVGEWSSDHMFVTFGSFTYPWTQFKFDLKTWESTVMERVKVPLDPDDFVVKQVWYSSKDGTKVPMFVVRGKSAPLDGNRPVYMTGYGGFNNALPPMFSQWAVVWMEHGGVYVLTNLRGGSEFGENWHRAAMVEKKQNTFDDFYAAAEWLIYNGYTKPSRIAIEGGSNGGLLVGAALTQRPELFGAVVCTYPLLDMIRYHKFMVAKYWVPEYGSADDSAQFRYLFKYSPYHNVKIGTKYPAVLFETGDADTRVAPLHARKMAAMVQASTGSGNPVLLLYDTKAGHSGGRSYDKIIADLVDQFSFLFWQLGMAE